RFRFLRSITFAFNEAGHIKAIYPEPGRAYPDKAEIAALDRLRAQIVAGDDLAIDTLADVYEVARANAVGHMGTPPEDSREIAEHLRRYHCPDYALRTFNGLRRSFAQHYGKADSREALDLLLETYSTGV